jgi:hypothetical protein
MIRKREIINSQPLFRNDKVNVTFPLPYGTLDWLDEGNSTGDNHHEREYCFKKCRASASGGRVDVDEHSAGKPIP